MQSYLSDPLHWPLGVHLKDATLCRARHSQLMPRVQANLLFTPASNNQSVKACLRSPPQPPNDENCFAIKLNIKKKNTKMETLHREI